MDCCPFLSLFLTWGFHKWCRGEGLSKLSSATSLHTFVFRMEIVWLKQEEKKNKKGERDNFFNVGAVFLFVSGGKTNKEACHISKNSRQQVAFNWSAIERVTLVCLQDILIGIKCSFNFTFEKSVKDCVCFYWKVLLISVFVVNHSSDISIVLLLQSCFQVLAGM